MKPSVFLRVRNHLPFYVFMIVVHCFYDLCIILVAVHVPKPVAVPVPRPVAVHIPVHGKQTQLSNLLFSFIIFTYFFRIFLFTVKVKVPHPVPYKVERPVPVKILQKGMSLLSPLIVAGFTVVPACLLDTWGKY